jgi:hypothetical protein
MKYLPLPSCPQPNPTEETNTVPTVIYRDDRKEATRITDRLKPYPDLGQTPCCEVTTNPTRTITRVYYASTQAPQPAPPTNQQDPFQQVPTGGWGSNLVDIYK